MSDLTSELNLALAVDDDDTADYLTTSEGLRGSLLTLDGLFSSSTGHAHNGAHQGGTLQFLDLTVGQNLVVNGSSTLKGSVVAQQNLNVLGATTLVTLGTSGLATLNSLDVTTTSRLRGTVTIDGTINSGGTLTIGQDLSVGRDLTVTRNATITGALTAGSISTGGGSLNVGANLTVGGAATIAGVITGQRLVLNNYDGGNVLNVGGNAVASGYFYNRSGAGRCWDNVDFTIAQAATAGTVVQRDGSAGINAAYVTIAGGNQAGKPTSVLGQSGDGVTRWWPTNAIGPPISTWYCQATLTNPSLSSSGGSQDATFNAIASSGGFGCSGTLITVPRPGYYSIAGGFNGNNLTGNSETMQVRLYASGHGQLDTLGVPLKISSYFGGFFSWSGYLDAGETIRLNYTTSFDSINGGGEILVAFIPTATYNN